MHRRPVNVSKIHRRVMVIGTAVLLILAAYVAGFALGDWQPYCPTEDSCQIDYSDGRWHVTPDVP